MHVEASKMEHELENIMFLQVPFELLVRRQIARLLEPSLQCARFIYDELVKVHLLFNLWLIMFFHGLGLVVSLHC